MRVSKPFRQGVGFVDHAAETTGIGEKLLQGTPKKFP